MAKMSAWSKKNRMNLLKLAFLLILAGFISAYIGGTAMRTALINFSFVLFGGSMLALLPLLTIKK